MEEMVQGVSNAKSLLRVYLEFSAASHQSKETSMEMKLTKKQLTAQLLHLKKLTKQMEKEVKPSAKFRTV